jgi:hypothetical protein
MTFGQLLQAYIKYHADVLREKTNKEVSLTYMPGQVLIDAIDWLQSYSCYVTKFDLEHVPMWRDENKKIEFILRYL